MITFTGIVSVARRLTTGTGPVLGLLIEGGTFGHKRVAVAPSTSPKAHLGTLVHLTQSGRLISSEGLVAELLPVDLTPQDLELPTPRSFGFYVGNAALFLLYFWVTYMALAVIMKVFGSRPDAWAALIASGTLFHFRRELLKRFFPDLSFSDVLFFILALIFAAQFAL